jgi:hypothetical protein
MRTKLESTLTPQQQLVIQKVAKHESIYKAFKEDDKIGVTERTFYNWINTIPGVEMAYRKAKKEYFDTVATEKSLIIRDKVQNIINDKLDEMKIDKKAKIDRSLIELYRVVHPGELDQVKLEKKIATFERKKAENIISDGMKRFEQAKRIN